MATTVLHWLRLTSSILVKLFSRVDEYCLSCWRYHGHKQSYVLDLCPAGGIFGQKYLLFLKRWAQLSILTPSAVNKAVPSLKLPA